MTPCEEAGYRVGDCFSVVGHPWLPLGTAIMLIEDNGSCQPLFETTAPTYPRPGAVYYAAGTKLYMSLGYLSRSPTSTQEPDRGSEFFPKASEVRYAAAFDSVEKPAHYAGGDIECIDAMRAQMSTFEFQGHMKGNVVKYMWRWREKGGVESLKKARWYLNKLIESAE
jgi:hypothetical protein